MCDTLPSVTHAETGAAFLCADLEITGAQSYSSYFTPTTRGPKEAKAEEAVCLKRNGGDDGARTRDLRRDRPAF